MSGASRTASPTPPSTHVDSERLTPVPPKKPLLPSVVSWSVNVVRQYPFLSTTLLYAFIVGGIAGVTKLYYNWDGGWPSSEVLFNRSGIELVGNSFRADIPNQIMSIGWVFAPSTGEGYEQAVDIYINNEYKPAFSYESTRFASDAEGGMILNDPVVTFKTDLNLDPYTRNMIPFDIYTLSALVFVIEKATNKSLPITTFTAGQETSGFVISSWELQVNSSWTHDSGMGPITVEVQASLLYMEVRRPLLARAFAVCLLVINSALTIGSAYVTLLAVVRRERVNDAVFFFPVTVVLTIPALRSLYPGSPPFGVYVDTFGFFLQMITVALCSMVLLYVVTMPSPPHRRACCDDKNTSSSGVEGDEPPQ